MLYDKEYGIFNISLDNESISSLIFETVRQLKATFESFHVIRAKVDFSFKFTIIGKFLN